MDMARRCRRRRAVPPLRVASSSTLREAASWAPPTMRAENAAPTLRCSSEARFCSSSSPTRRCSTDIAPRPLDDQWIDG